MKNVKKLGLQHHSPPYTIIISGISSLTIIYFRNDINTIIGLFGNLIHFKSEGLGHINKI